MSQQFISPQKKIVAVVVVIIIVVVIVLVGQIGVKGESKNQTTGSHLEARPLNPFSSDNLSTGPSL